MKRVNTAVWQEKYSRWQIKVQKDGTRKAFYSPIPGRTGQRECNQKADEWLDEGILHANTKSDKIFDMWIEELKITTSYCHWKQYESYGKIWIKPKIKHLNPEEITEQTLQTIVNYAFSKKLAKKALSNIAACSKAFIKYCRKSKLTTLLPENVYIPRQAPKKEKVILQPEDISKLFKYDNTLYNGKEIYELYINAYRFEVATGLRPGEVIGLKKNDITKNRINIRRAINQYQIETTGKNDNARRTFGITNTVRNILENQEKKLDELGIESEYVFPNESGDYIKPQVFYRRWVSYRDYIGISKVTPYELRHTFVSVVKCLPEGLLKPLVGHSKDMDTYGIYSHEITGDVDITAQKVDDIFKRIL